MRDQSAKPNHLLASFLILSVVCACCPAADGGGNADRIQVIQDDRAITIKADGKNILSYQHAVCDVPEGVDPLFRRGGFIHPLWSPAGQVLTRIQPPDHYHHYGIWAPWTKTTVEGREVDFWNLGSGQGTVRFAGVDFLRSGEKQGGFRVRQDHVELAGEKAPRTVLKETLEVRAGEAKVGGQTVWVIDLASTFVNVLDSLVVLEQYRYGGGIGFRATEDWNKDNCRVLTSEGKTRQDADGSRARWCDVSGGADRSGILFLSHPDNYQHPEPMRVWPDNILPTGDFFFEFCPIRHVAWTLQPQQPYPLRYRMVVYDGSLNAETAEELWKDYAAGQPEPQDMKKVLIYTKNGKGYVHDNIAAGVKCLQKICEDNQWACEVTDDASVFTPEQIRAFDVLVFSNTNNETFDTDEQKAVFQEYIRAGGGFVGIHSACGSERAWPWFWANLGGKFVRHPVFQPFDIHVVDKAHPSTGHLPAVWHWEDECYFMNELNPGMHVLLAVDLRTLEDGDKDKYPDRVYGDYFPLCWCQEFEGGRQWYTALGHDIMHYEDENFIRHLTGGIAWAMGQSVNR